MRRNLTIDSSTYKNKPTNVWFIALMEVNRRTVSPDFAAEEVIFFRKLSTAFSCLQAQCEHEKTTNQRSFERDQQAIQQRICDLESESRLLDSQLSEFKDTLRVLEDAMRRTARELQQKKDEAIKGRITYHELEERRRRKYSALLEGASATNLRILLVCFFSMNARENCTVCNLWLKT